VKLTDAGTRYLEDARRILAEVDEADAAAVGINAAPLGLLLVTAPVLFGKLYVMPIMTEFQSVHEKVEVTGLFVDRVVNFIDEGIDVGIRIGQLPDSSLRAIRVGQVRRVVVGSPRYLQQAGIPQSPDELAAHRLIASSGVSPTHEWAFQHSGNTIGVRVRPRMTVNSNDAALAAALSGYGLTRLLSYQVAPQLASGELQTVLSNYEGPNIPVQVIHREGRTGAAKVRLFVDLAVQRLRENKAIN
jgi:DNA-binding transcriptional LysR family regulator